ncbi:hypothetical protein F2Q69_00031102 [Brassica cretica]|uniref:Neprosin PEP catalytic domain-containing protein n=1 Tax=Brassica cretica TaxID=69181 RepID=A0A8S9SBG5_BRACR|nr:hypothetical protein F2Q69_00031102 [Brassica cretica]
MRSRRDRGCSPQRVQKAEEKWFRWRLSGFELRRNEGFGGGAQAASCLSDGQVEASVDAWRADDEISTRANGYQGTGCYNNDCAGFVQRSNKIAVGGTYNTFSQYDGDQYELSVLIWKDGENWWLQIGEELVGYWPGQLFNSLGNGATIVQWGGEIVNRETDGKHTGTDMGSGHFAEEGYKKASYFRNLMPIDETNTLSEPQGVYPTTGHDNCYNIKAGDGGTSWGVN